MSQAAIRKQRKAVEKEIAAVERELKAAEARLAALQDKCRHPNMRRYSACGEIGSTCGDCGYQD